MADTAVPTKERIDLSVIPVGGDLSDPRAVLKEALVKLAIRAEGHKDKRNTHGVGSVIEYEIISLAITLLDPSFDTMAVGVEGDGVMRLWANPDFTVGIGPEGAAFVLSHEAYHIMYAHPLVADPELRKDENWTLACEAVINDRVMRHLGVKELPKLDGKSTGVDPDAIVEKIRAHRREMAKTDPSVTIPTREEILASDMACRAFLAELPKPPKTRNDFCRHGEAGDGGGDGESGQGTIDGEQAQTIVDRALDGLMQRALRGDQTATDALLELGEQTGGKDGQLWGTLGLGALVGETQLTPQVKFWEYFFSQACASILQPGTRMAYPRKMAGAEDFYIEAGCSGIPLMPIGLEPELEVWAFADNSGSMSSLYDRIGKTIGNIAGSTIRWFTFDTDVYEIKPGEGIRGGGGTDFGCIDKFVSEQEAMPDLVIVLTDGFAPPINPMWGHLAIWLITMGGDMWPMDHGMECIETDVPMN
jgi:hypothetical protein